MSRIQGIVEAICNRIRFENPKHKTLPGGHLITSTCKEIGLIRQEQNLDGKDTVYYWWEGDKTLSMDLGRLVLRMLRKRTDFDWKEFTKPERTRKP